MPVYQVQAGMIVEPNQVYVIPPNKKMTLAQGVLQLAPREKIHGICLLMRSLRRWQSGEVLRSWC